MPQELTIPTNVLAVAAGLTFSLGFFCGYKFKSWRIEWLKRRRERLQRKIQQTQAEIDQMQRS